MEEMLGEEGMKECRESLDHLEMLEHLEHLGCLDHLGPNQIFSLSLIRFSNLKGERRDLLQILFHICKPKLDQ